jgi:ribosomal protein L10
MNKNFKTYKLYKVKHFLKNPPLIFFFHVLNLKSKNWLKIEQNLLKLNLKYYKIKNTLAKRVIKKSIFLNFSTFINGAICVIYPKNFKITNDVQKLLKTNQTMPLLNVKLNKNFYSKEQLSTISTLNYKKNVKILNKTLKTFLKTPYYKFKN